VLAAAAAGKLSKAACQRWRSVIVKVLASALRHTFLKTGFPAAAGSRLWCQRSALSSSAQQSLHLSRALQPSSDCCNNSSLHRMQQLCCTHLAAVVRAHCALVLLWMCSGAHH
jgi:hypothetical protein